MSSLSSNTTQSHIEFFRGPGMSLRYLPGDTVFTLRRYNIDLDIQLICCGLTILILETQIFLKQLIPPVHEIQYMGITKNRQL